MSLIKKFGFVLTSTAVTATAFAQVDPIGNKTVTPPAPANNTIYYVVGAVVVVVVVIFLLKGKKKD